MQDLPQPRVGECRYSSTIPRFLPVGIDIHSAGGRPLLHLQAAILASR